MPKNINPLSNAYNKVIKLIKLRDRSSQEIEHFLLKEGVDESLISKFIKNLEEDGLLNDLKFAQNRIASRVNLKSWGKLRIKGELLSLGISKEIIDEELAKVEEEEWIKQATKLLKKYLQSTTYQKRKDINSVRKKLLLMGYEEDIIQKVLKNSEELQKND